MKDNILQEKIKDLEDLLERKKAAIPRHSVRPYQVLEIEDMEEKLLELKRKKETGHDSGSTKH